MKTKLEPAGTNACEKFYEYFNPHKHKVMLCYDIKDTDWRLGFDAYCGKKNGFVSFIFRPLIGVVEWNGGNIKFGGNKTNQRFIKAFQRVYGCKPKIAKTFLNFR